MSEEERDAIYRKRYWVQIGGDQLRPGEDLAVFDFAVNSGPARAKAALARAAFSNAGPEVVAHSICKSRLSFMHAVTKGGGWRVFGPGWGRRVSACEALAVRMVHGTAAGPILKGKARGAAQKSHNGKINAVLSAGAGTLGSAQPVISGHQSVDVALFIGAVATMAAFWFAAWRDSQREEAFRAEAAKVPSQKEENPVNHETSSLVSEESGAP
jgi:lysozyme family protein